MTDVTFLKVKIMELAAEARIIRGQEHKAKKKYRKFKGRQGYEDAYDRHVDRFWGLRHHRTGKVRYEARDSLLAYGFIRGKTYRTIESTGNPVAFWNWSYDKKTYIPVYAIDLKNIARMASTYGDRDVTEVEIENWLLAEEPVAA